MVASREPSSADDVARHYDQLDRFYRDIWGVHVHHGYWKTGRETPEQAARALVDLVIEHAQLKPGMRVLDVGCGYGATSRILAQECGASVTGLTISTAQHAFAQSVTEPHGNPQYIAGDWIRNECETESFDVVLAIESTEHMPDKHRAFTEIARVLKPGGRMVVTAWLAAEHRTHWQDVHLVRPICREGRLAAVGTTAEYQGWIAAAGLQLQDALDISTKVSRTWPALAWRFCQGLVRHPGHLRILLDAEQDNRIFALTMLRIWLAYKLGAMRMAVFSAGKPPGSRN